MKKQCWIVVLGFLISSCQEEVTLPLNELDELVPVIEATWSDISAYNEVQISLAENYMDSTSYTIVTDAEVVIINQTNRDMLPFRFDPNSFTYKPVLPFEVAKVGSTYLLRVKWNGHVYESQGVMLAPPIIDSVTYKFQEERLFRDEGYYIKVYGEIPFVENNFYRIKIIENDTIKNDRDDFLLFDDTFGLEFFEDGLELGYPFDAGDVVRMELYRMNEGAFIYLNQLVNLLYSDGGLFSPPPQNPESNIRVVSDDSQVMGYFNVSPILTETVVIDETK